MADKPDRSLTPQSISKLQKWLVDQVARSVQLQGSDRPPAGQIQQLLNNALDQAQVSLEETQRERIVAAAIDDLYGLGPIQPLLEDPDITEVMVNGSQKVFIERDGKLEKTDIVFPNQDAVLQLIDRIILPLGRRIDADSPTVDARLPDGSRVNAVIPPAAIDGPSITIRKFARERLRVDDLIRYGSLTQHMATFLEACVAARLNVLVSGGTGSGKTTLLNILSEHIPENERIVTIEDAAELQLHQDHTVRLEAQPPGVDDSGEITIRHLVRNALRMRPDRIIVGEVRGGEALDMLQAMNTGHDGSLTTIHANSARDAISRLETLTLLAGFELPLRVIREQIASAIDVIAQATRFSDGSRKVTSITEVAGLEGETVVMTEIFGFERRDASIQGQVSGAFRPSGMRPMFEPRLKAAGFSLPPEVFGADLTTITPPRQRGRR